VNRRGSILVAVLWCVALLSVIVVGALHSASLDLRVVKNHGDLVQAYYLAIAGVEKTKALLYHEAADRKRAGRTHNQELYDAPHHFRDVPLGRGQFRVFRRDPQGGSLIYGISDEESRLNLNRASAEELAKLQGVTPQIAAAIVDYRDSDGNVTPGGAEADQYALLKPPYLPRNAPLRSLREVLMVHGISRESFLGEDANLNGLLDPSENDGDRTFPADNGDGFLDAGWSEFVTVDSTERNVSARGADRVHIQDGSESSLAAVEGISAELAKAIVAHREQNRLENLADLLDVVAVNREQQGQPPPGGSGSRSSAPSPPQTRPPSTGSGEKLITQDLLWEIADGLTASPEDALPGAVNINTASATVLACLPGISREVAEAIVSFRQSSGFFENIAWLLKVPGLNQQTFKQVAGRVTARSETFRIMSEGKVTSTGARKRIEAVIRVGDSSVETLSFREDDL
jgi:competence ComEA-like helix-hairpin-helix protein